MCRACKLTYNASYYTRTKERHNPTRGARRAKLRLERQRQVRDYLQDKACTDCGETDIVVLEFDHQADKLESISRMMNNGATWAKILAEIAKCEIVCANDHRRRTARQFGSHRLSAVSSVGRAGDS